MTSFFGKFGPEYLHFKHEINTFSFVNEVRKNKPKKSFSPIGCAIYDKSNRFLTTWCRAKLNCSLNCPLDHSLICPSNCPLKCHFEMSFKLSLKLSPNRHQNCSFKCPLNCPEMITKGNRILRYGCPHVTLFGESCSPLSLKWSVTLFSTKRWFCSKLETKDKRTSQA